MTRHDRRRPDAARFFTVFLAVLLCAEPKPGDVFREFSYTHRFSELDLNSRREGLEKLRAGSVVARQLEIPDLRSALRAEVVVEYWGGHIGTSSQQLRVNGGEWMDIPQPVGTPTSPHCYYRTLSRATVQLPLNQLRTGSNWFQFRAGPQICYGFDWGFYWIYGFTVRVYYDPSRAHPRGEIIYPYDGAVVSDSPRFVVRAEGAEAAIASVEFLGRYEDFNWEGDGVWRQWHYRLERGRLRNHIGTAVSPPYVVRWDTTWVPDQQEPVEIAARITDTLGMTYLTAPVSVRLVRPNRSVKMFKPVGVPENFGVRKGRRMTCGIPVEGDLANIRQARLLLSSWSAAHEGVIELNGTPVTRRFGVIHNYSFDSIPVPARLIRNGVNEFAIVSATNEHAAEVNWPGPVLLVEYDVPRPVAAGKAPWWHRAWKYRLPITVDAGLCEQNDRPVEVSLKLSKYRLPRGEARLVETSQNGSVLDESVPFQIDPEDDESAELILLLKGRATAGAITRTAGKTWSAIRTSTSSPSRRRGTRTAKSPWPPRKLASTSSAKSRWRSTRARPLGCVRPRSAPGSSTW